MYLLDSANSEEDWRQWVSRRKNSPAQKIIYTVIKANPTILMVYPSFDLGSARQKQDSPSRPISESEDEADKKQSQIDVVEDDVDPAQRDTILIHGTSEHVKGNVVVSE